jgi:uncharacterized protein YcbK (DUF882 family)
MDMSITKELGLKYFELSEFDCNCSNCANITGTGAYMNPEFLIKLDKARELAKTSFFITSGYRCFEHNINVGGRVGSEHPKGNAVDIRYNDSAQRYAILKGLLDAGFTRIGLGKTFIHVDCSTEKTQSIIWTYEY